MGTGEGRGIHHLRMVSRAGHARELVRYQYRIGNRESHHTIRKFPEGKHSISFVRIF